MLPVPPAASDVATRRACAIRALLDHPSAKVRVAAIWRLGWLPGDEGVVALRNALRDPDRVIRRAAFARLDVLPIAERGPALRQALDMAPSDIDVLGGLHHVPMAERAAPLDVILSQPDPHDLLHIIALPRLRLLPAADRLPHLQAALQSEEPGVQSAALRLLDLLPPEALAIWVRSSVRSTVPEVASHALRQVRVLPVEERHRILREGLATTGPLRLVALHQIRWLPRAECVLATQAAMRDGDEAERLAAVEAVWQIPAADRADILRAGCTDPVAAVRRSAVARLGMLPPAEHLPIIRAALLDGDAGVRLAAVERTSLLPVAEQAAAVRVGLADGDRWVWAAARRFLPALPEAERLALAAAAAPRFPAFRPRYRPWDPARAPARLPDAPVSSVEIEAILTLVMAWHLGSADGEQAGRPILVEQHAATTSANSGAVWANDPVAAWRVDQYGSRQLTGEEARNERVAVADGDFTGPGMLRFAPVTGTTFLVLGHMAAPRAGHGELIEIGVRGGIRLVLWLWPN